MWRTRQSACRGPGGMKIMIVVQLLVLSPLLPTLFPRLGGTVHALFRAPHTLPALLLKKKIAIPSPLGHDPWDHITVLLLPCKDLLGT